MTSVASRDSFSGGRLVAFAPPPAMQADSLSLLGASSIELRKAADAARLFCLEQLEVSYDAKTSALWSFMRPRGRPSYSLSMLGDIHAMQDGIVARFAGRANELRYLVAGSRSPGVFSLGGDLDLFAACIRNHDRQALIDYGKSCVRVLHRFHTALDLPIITIGLAQGDALGGGLESLLSFNVIIAERTAKFGFPETLFGLFPGMGAYSIVSRRTNAAFAEEMMLSGRTYSADEMKEAGLVHMVVEPGQGIEAAKDFIARSQSRHAGIRAVYDVGRRINPMSLDELDDVVRIWADCALNLSDRDLKLMQRLVAAQNRLPKQLQAAE
jgi:DSF synthase